jgi:hypothetical protein
MKNKTLVLGASDNPERYSCMAIKNLRAMGHPVLAVGNKKGRVGDTEISERPLTDDSIDTITLYLNATRQKEYYDYITGLKPRRIIFNPGAENEELAHIAQNNDIQVVEACTLVMLRTGQY